MYQRRPCSSANNPVNGWLTSTSWFEGCGGSKCRSSEPRLSKWKRFHVFATRHLRATPNYRCRKWKTLQTKSNKIIRCNGITTRTQCSVREANASVHLHLNHIGILQFNDAHLFSFREWLKRRRLPSTSLCVLVLWWARRVIGTTKTSHEIAILLGTRREHSSKSRQPLALKPTSEIKNEKKLEQRAWTIKLNRKKNKQTAAVTTARPTGKPQIKYRKNAGTSRRGSRAHNTTVQVANTSNVM